MRVKLAAVRLDETGERLLVTCSGLGEELALVHC
jgi:hypothetical protein